MSEIKGNKILILGFGREGKSALSYLEKHYPEKEVAVVDKDPNTLTELTITTFSGEKYLDNIDEYDTVIKSPGIPKTLPQLACAKHVTTLTNIFFENCKNTIIGITGTKGKSTTSSLIAHILKSKNSDVRLVGNVGTPMLDFLDGANEKTLFVVELSSYQLDDIHYSPHIAVLLPIYQEHLSYHEGFENYVNAKANITRFQTDKDYLCFYEDNAHSTAIAKRSSAIALPFSKIALPTNLLGDANKINIAGAFTACKLFMDEEDIKQAISTFVPLPDRLESVGIFNGIEFINDTLSTIPEATIHALDALGAKAETLIAGGHDRGVDFSNIGPAIVKSNIKTLILFPTTGEKIEGSLPKNNIRIFHTDSMEEAVHIAYENTEHGAAVLLSPASTSFNMFRDYKERGDMFKKYVRKLAK